MKTYFNIAASKTFLSGRCYFISKYPPSLQMIGGNLVVFCLELLIWSCRLSLHMQF